jgi:hypothetical protein
MVRLKRGATVSVTLKTWRVTFLPANKIVLISPRWKSAL